MLLRSLLTTVAISAVATSSASAAAPALKTSHVRIFEGHAGTKVALVTVGLPQRAKRAVRFRYATGALSAGNADFTAASGTARIRKGARRTTIAISIAGDRVPEADERFVVRLSKPSGARLLRKAVTVTILDDDKAAASGRPKPYPIGFDDAIGGEPERTVAVHAPAVSEPSAAGASSPHGAAIRLNRKSSVPVTVSYTVATQTATMPADADMPSGTVTFAPGETEKVLPGTVEGDALDEDDETVKIILSDAKGAKIAPPAATLVITDAAEDVPPAASVGDVAYDEVAGTKDVVVPVTLDAASGKTVTVEFTTQNGSATAGSCAGGGDYVAKSATLLIPPGATTAGVSVTICEDKVLEFDETFTAVLFAPSNATLGDASGTLTIQDDD